MVAYRRSLTESGPYWVKRLPNKVLFMSKVNFKKKSGTSHWKITVSCTTQECDNVTTPYYVVYTVLSVTWLLLRGPQQRKMSNFKRKVVTITYRRCLLTWGWKYSDFTLKLLVCWKTGRWGEVVTTRDSLAPFFLVTFWLADSLTSGLVQKATCLLLIIIDPCGTSKNTLIFGFTFFTWILHWGWTSNIQ